MGSLSEWSCERCTYVHKYHAARCVMCDAFRISKQQMRDFTMGKTISASTNTANKALPSGDTLPKPPTATTATNPMAVAAVNSMPQKKSVGTRHVKTIVNPYSKSKSTVQVLSQLQPQPQRPVTVPPMTTERIPTKSDDRPRSAPSNPYQIRQQPSKPQPQGPVIPNTTLQKLISTPLPPRMVETTEMNSAPPTRMMNHTNTQQSNNITRRVPHNLGQMDSTNDTCSMVSNQVSCLPTPPPHPQCPNSSSMTEPKTNPFILASTKTTAQSSTTCIPGPVPLNSNTSNEWFYPTNEKYPIRQYQMDMSQSAVMQNTLVSLPTGLGKTLIAAVVMYNYYRWFPQGKVVFCAPTRPLVTQQIEACYKIMGIPAGDTAEISGKTKPEDRQSLWNDRRMFFCTPQTLQKDIDENRCDARSVVCIVLDEAHKAKGDYAYTKVVDQIERSGAKFRVLGLSATPGTGIPSIQEVITALRISKVEAKLDTDPDVKRYIHDRQFEVIKVKQSSEIMAIERLFNDLVNPLIDALKARNALYSIRGGNATLTQYCMMRAREAYVSATGDTSANHYFYILQALLGIRTDLNVNGIGVVKTKLQRLMTDARKGFIRNTIEKPPFQALWNAVADATAKETTASQNSAVDLKMNNPKLVKLDEILSEHFESAQSRGESSRAIVFSQWRDSVEEIVRMLSVSEPLLRPRKFVGQSKTSGGGNKDSSKNTSLAKNSTDGTAGMKQKEQQEVIRLFREGRYNVIVCTCIGEEGLDIGEVDLIVNFDCLKSPIRMIQRTGRTGRKRNGRVVCLVAEGQEEQRLTDNGVATRTLGRALRDPSKFKLSRNLPMFPHPPTMVQKQMEIRTEYHFSQVGGHNRTAKKVKQKQHSRKAPGLSLVDNWKLTNEQEEQRTIQFGHLSEEYTAAELSEVKMDSFGCRLFPINLRRKFIRSRGRQAHSKADDRIELGKTSRILRNLEKRHGKQEISKKSPPCTQLATKDSVSPKSSLGITPKSGMLLSEIDNDAYSVISITSDGQNVDKNMREDDVHYLSSMHSQGIGHNASLDEGGNDISVDGDSLDDIFGSIQNMSIADNDALDVSGIFDQEKHRYCSVEPPPDCQVTHGLPYDCDIEMSVDSSGIDSNASQIDSDGQHEDAAGFSQDDDALCDVFDTHLATSQLSPNDVDNSGNLSPGVQEKKSSDDVDTSDLHQTTAANEREQSIVLQLPTQSDSSSSSGSDDAESIKRDRDCLTLTTSKVDCLKVPEYVTTPKMADVEQNVHEEGFDVQSIPHAIVESVSAHIDPFSTRLVENTSSSGLPNPAYHRVVAQPILLEQSPTDKVHENDSPQSIYCETNMQERIIERLVPVGQDHVDEGESQIDPLSLPTQESSSSDDNDSDEDESIQYIATKSQTKVQYFASSPEELSGKEITCITTCAEFSDAASTRDTDNQIPLDIESESVLDSLDIMDTPVKVKRSKLSSKGSDALLSPLLTPVHGIHSINTDLIDTPDIQRDRMSDQYRKSDNEMYGQRPCTESSDILVDTPEKRMQLVDSIDTELVDTPETPRDPISNQYSKSGRNTYIKRACTDNSHMDALVDTPGKAVSPIRGIHLKAKDEAGAMCDLIDDEASDCMVLDVSTCSQVKTKARKNSRHAFLSPHSSQHGVNKTSSQSCTSDIVAFELEDTPQKPDNLNSGQVKDKAIRKKRLRRKEKAPHLDPLESEQLTKKLRSENIDCSSLEESENDARLKKMLRIKKRIARQRALHSCKFIETGVDIDSDEDIDGDDAEAKELREIEEDELSHDSFINDTSQLGYTQDALSQMGMGATQEVICMYPNDEASTAIHRSIDNNRERLNEFATPILNRRMQKDVGSQESSQKGLGNMHFIRSVLLHHRNGGDADEIEEEYNRMEEETMESEASQVQHETEQTPPPIVLPYVESQSVPVRLSPSPATAPVILFDGGVRNHKLIQCDTIPNVKMCSVFKETTNRGNMEYNIKSSARVSDKQMPPPEDRAPKIQSNVKRTQTTPGSGLTDEQRQLIEANRQRALRLRAERLRVEQLRLAQQKANN